MVNKIIGVVKIILREAVIREKLDRDPTECVRNVSCPKASTRAEPTTVETATFGERAHSRRLRLPTLRHQRGRSAVRGL
jgi:hypothetical protein